METKKIGISRDLIIHPGETIADVLEEKEISQAELSIRTGVSKAYISNVIAGKKDISAKFAFDLEYALGVPKSFWLNLQANYDAEMLEFNKKNSITKEERNVSESLTEIAGYLRKKQIISGNDQDEDYIFSLRKTLQVSNLSNLKNIAADNITIVEQTRYDYHIVGAWIRMCQILLGKNKIDKQYDASMTDNMINSIKTVMVNNNAGLNTELKKILGEYGIIFCVLPTFKHVPIKNYISTNAAGTYNMALTVDSYYAYQFWTSLFHGIGHIVNGDVKKKYIDDAALEKKENAANAFALQNLISQVDYEMFVNGKKFDIEMVNNFAKSQNIVPDIIVSRLQADNYINHKQYSEYLTKYKVSELIG